MKQCVTTSDGLGVEITGIDLTAVDTERAAEIKALVHEHKLLVFRDQRLSESELVAFGRLLGRPEPYFQEHYWHPEHPEIFVSSNVAVDGEKVGVAGTGRFWHVDYQFMSEPLPLTIISPRVLPAGERATFFIDSVRAYEELPDGLRDVADKAYAFNEATRYYKVQPWDVDKAIVELIHEFRAVSDGAVHPVVIPHPVTGRRALFVTSGFTSSIMGLSHDDSTATLAELFRHQEDDERIHVHSWDHGDILLWDNRQVSHKASEYGQYAASEPQTNYRVTVYDGLPFYEETVPRDLGPIKRWSSSPERS